MRQPIVTNSYFLALAYIVACEPLTARGHYFDTTQSTPCSVDVGILRQLAAHHPELRDALRETANVLWREVEDECRERLVTIMTVNGGGEAVIGTIVAHHTAYGDIVRFIAYR